jgi:hypothetical protein
LEEEKATLEEMTESRDELLMGITREIGLDHMVEGEDEEEEEEDANDGGDAAAPPTTAPPPLAPPAAVHEEIDEKGPMEAIPEQKALMPHEVIVADAEPEVPQLCLYHAILRDYDENLLRLEDDFGDLDDDPSEDDSDGEDEADGKKACPCIAVYE